MIGTIIPKSNNLYVFFEEDEVKELDNGEVSGVFINHDDPSKIGKLKATLDNNTRELIDTDIEFGDSSFVESIHVKIRGCRYSRLVETGTAGEHQGYRHIELYDTKNHKMDFNYKMLFKYLKLQRKSYCSE